VSIAVLCNVSTGQAERYAHAVADLYLQPGLQPSAKPQTVILTNADLDSRAGLYRDLTTGAPMAISRDKDGLRLQNAALLPVSATRFVSSNGRNLEFDSRGGVRINNPNGTVESYERVQPANPTGPQLNAYAGTYTSDEAEVTMKVGVGDGALEISRRPNTTFRLTPVYADTFNAPSLGIIRFHRGPSGQVTEFSVVQDRVWDLRFKK
jgi:hypothetical protein